MAQQDGRCNKEVTWSLWAFWPNFRLIKVNQQGVKVQTVWHDEVSDVVPSDRHMVQCYRIFAFENELNLLQMSVHCNINT